MTYPCRAFSNRLSVSLQGIGWSDWRFTCTSDLPVLAMPDPFVADPFLPGNDLCPSMKRVFDDFFGFLHRTLEDNQLALLRLHFHVEVGEDRAAAFVVVR